MAEETLSSMHDARDAEDKRLLGMLLPAERRILVNVAEPEPRQRFRIAHELGHWICEAKAREREVNIFAANLVMPEPAVRAADGENRFGVSDEALAWRLYNLGLASSPPIR